MGEERQRLMDEYIDPSPGIIASVLAPQLGSDTDKRMKGTYDMTRLSVIEDKKIGALLYADIRGDKSAFWRRLHDSYMNHMVSVGGRGRRDIIRMEAVSKGLPTSVESEIRRPGWFGRNVYQRQWDQEERERLGLE